MSGCAPSATYDFRIVHVRGSSRRSPARTSTSARRVRRRDAVAAVQCVQRGAGDQQGAGAGHCDPLQRAGRGAAAALITRSCSTSTASKWAASSSRTCRCRRRSRRRSTSARACCGRNLNDFVKYQMAKGFEKGGAGVAGSAPRVAVGMAMAGQMMNQPPASPAGYSGGSRRRQSGTGIRHPETLTRRMPQRHWGFPKPMSSPASSGDLKGKRIGSQWPDARPARGVPAVGRGETGSGGPDAGPDGDPDKAPARRSSPPRSRSITARRAAPKPTGTPRKGPDLPFCGTESAVTLQMRDAATVVVEHDLTEALRNIPDAARVGRLRKPPSAVRAVRRSRCVRSGQDRPSLRFLRLGAAVPYDR